MKCTVIFVLGDACPKNSLLIESLLFEGYSCKRLQTNCMLTNFEVVFLVIWYSFGHFLTLVPSSLINFGMANTYVFFLNLFPVLFFFSLSL